jgi:hypothetical protein
MTDDASNGGRTVRISGRALLAATAGLAAVVAVPVLTGTSSASGQTVSAAPTSLDGPGSYYVFRTLDSGQNPPAAQDAACNNYFGSLRSLSVVERLDARLYSFTSSPTSGFLTDQTAQLLGPGYLCLAPGFSGADILEGYASTSLPGVGVTNMHGHCGVQPLIAQPGSAVVDCDLTILPNGANITGGVATSSSIGNPLKLSGAPTGSVWTAYVTGSVTSSVPAPVSGGQPDTGNAQFSVSRELNSVASPATAACAGGTRRTELHAVQTDPATSKVVGSPSATVAGTATICYSKPSAPDFGASLTLSLNGVSPALAITSSGHCRQQAVPGVTGSVQQSCGFAIPLNLLRGLNGGLVTTSGLVPAASPAQSANSAVWSVSLLGGPKPTS